MPGRFCPGEITTGLAYSLDPYRNHVVVASIQGRCDERRAASADRDRPGQRSSRRGATGWRPAGYFAATPEIFGEPESVETEALLLRDALVSHLRAGGLADATG